MYVYDLLLLVGGIGFLAIALLGMSHDVVGHGHSLGHSHGPLATHGHGHGHLGKLHLPKGSKSAERQGSPWLMLLSPVDLFSLALGAGLTGVLLRTVLSPSLLVWAAVAGALTLDFLVIKPMFSLAMKFVTKPSEGLEGTVKVMGEAVTKFDSRGQGIVRLELDGQIIQLLADLDTAERELGESVAKGDTVVVVAVDGKRNRCTVSRISAGRNP